MRKVTVRATSDVALVKYWGKKDAVLRLPENGSISMKLAGLETITSVEFLPELTQDSVLIGGAQDVDETRRVVAHLDRIRNVAGTTFKARVESKNSFPKGTGLSSSGSGFAALTIAATQALDLGLSEKELSILARQGSGTACRCVCGGFVEWRDGETSEASYSETIYPADYWDVRDVIAVVDEGKKLVSSTEGHESAGSSILFAARQEKIADKIVAVKKALREKNFEALGELVEAEALEFHSILLTSKPPLIAWYPGTIEVMLSVQQLRREGIPAYFTINTGFNVHVLTLPEYESVVQERLEALDLVKKTLLSRVGGKPEVINE